LAANRARNRTAIRTRIRTGVDGPLSDSAFDSPYDSMSDLRRFCYLRQQLAYLVVSRIFLTARNIQGIQRFDLICDFTKSDFKSFSEDLI
jgi:hypothetical protein